MGVSIKTQISIFLALIFAVQFGFGYSTKSVKPYWEILPVAPTESSLNASSFGDRQFLYRSLVMSLQNFGDGGGRVTPLKNYDMKQVIAWLDALDALDVHAHHHVALALRYFSQTQDRSQLKYLIDWTQAHVAKDAERKQWWLTAAIMVASGRMHDLPLALRLAEQLASYDFPSTRIEAFQYPAFIKEQMGDYAGAATIIEAVIAKHKDRFSEKDIVWTRAYLAALNSAANGELGMLRSHRYIQP